MRFAKGEPACLPTSTRTGPPSFASPLRYALRSLAFGPLTIESAASIWGNFRSTIDADCLDRAAAAAADSGRLPTGVHRQDRLAVERR
jgi:hypothetical protein